LTYRCSKDFLKEYIEDPSVLERVAKPGLALSASPEVGLAVRLHEFGLLTEQQRRSFIQKVMEYPVDGDDLYGIESRKIQGVFTPAELAKFRQRVGRTNPQSIQGLVALEV